MTTERRLLVWDTPIATALAVHRPDLKVFGPVYDPGLDVVTPDGSLNEYHLRNVSDVTVRYAGHPSAAEDLSMCQELRRELLITYLYMMDRRNRARNLDIYSMDELFRIHVLTLLRYFKETEVTHVIMGAPSSGYDLVASEVIKRLGGKSIFALQLHYGRFCFGASLDCMFEFRPRDQMFSPVAVQLEIASNAPWYMNFDKICSVKRKSMRSKINAWRATIDTDRTHLRGPMAGFSSLRRINLLRNFLDRMYRQTFEPTNTLAPRFGAVETTPGGTGTSVCLYALNVQPEALTVSTADNQWENPAYCLDKLLTLLPSDWEVWVKPHPNQTRGFRSVLFWEIVQSSNRVRVIESHAAASEFMPTASLVATINGTIGWEAILSGIPVLHFGSAWYQEFPGAVHVDAVQSVSDLPEPHSWTIAQVEESLRYLSRQMAPGFINHLDYVLGVDPFEQQLGTQEPLAENLKVLCASLMMILDVMDDEAAATGFGSSGE